MVGVKITEQHERGCLDNDLDNSAWITQCLESLQQHRGFSSFQSSDWHDSDQDHIGLAGFRTHSEVEEQNERSFLDSSWLLGIQQVLGISRTSWIEGWNNGLRGFRRTMPTRTSRMEGWETISTQSTGIWTERIRMSLERKYRAAVRIL
ncbi:unnamed protein product [Caenorhabditis nigoni]